MLQSETLQNKGFLKYKLTDKKTELLNEPPHDKTNKMICAPSEDSDQPGHPHFFMQKAKTLIRLGGCPG